MPTKNATSKKTASKVRDLSARKDPKGGAQKKEGPNMSGGTRGGSTTRSSKTRLS